MYISNSASRKITEMNSLCIILIVLMHSIVQTKILYAQFFLNTIFYGFTRIAVPVFFLISSILFFRDFSVKDNYVRKIRRRFFSLAIPYLLTILLYIFIYLLSQQINSLRAFYSPEDIIENWTISKFLSKLFIFPFNPALWFIRDLFIAYLFAPVIHVILKCRILGCLFTLVLSVVWVATTNRQIGGLFVIVIGYFIVSKNIFEVIHLHSNIAYLILSIFVISCFVIGWGTTSYGWERGLAIFTFITKIIILSGVYSIYFIYKNNFFDSFSNLLHRFYKFFFFIYLSHMLLIHIVRNIVEKYCSSSLPLFSYLIIVITTLILGSILYEVMKKACPAFLNVLLGNRL